jgi:hypothetical protein
MMNCAPARQWIRPVQTRVALDSSWMIKTAPASPRFHHSRNLFVSLALSTMKVFANAYARVTMSAIKILSSTIILASAFAQWASNAQQASCSMQDHAVAFVKRKNNAARDFTLTRIPANAPAMLLKFAPKVSSGTNYIANAQRFQKSSVLPALFSMTTVRIVDVFAIKHSNVHGQKLLTRKFASVSERYWK